MLHFVHNNLPSQIPQINMKVCSMRNDERVHGVISSPGTEQVPAPYRKAVLAWNQFVFSHPARARPPPNKRRHVSQTQVSKRQTVTS
jgi:hypothetical protein